MFTKEEEAMIEEGRKRWQGVPKAELHVHLGGTVRPATLVELAASKGQPRPRIAPGRSTLSECFEIFRAVHDAVCTGPDIARITREAVTDMAADGVRYLELRTTPRDLADGVSAADYVDIVVDAARREIAERGLDIAVGVLVSVDRARPVAEAERNVRIAAQHAPSAAVAGTRAGAPFAGVVGVDLSGNPGAGSFAAVQPALDYARDAAGLPVTVHAAECERPAETRAVLAWGPRRVGHAVCVADAGVRAEMAACRVPVEVCLSSNLFSRSIAAPRAHPFVASGSTNPRCLCTDDPGVFATTLSREWAIAEALCGLPPAELLAMSRNSLEYSFAPPAVLDHCRPLFARASVHGAPAPAAPLAGSPPTPLSQ